MIRFAPLLVVAMAFGFLTSGPSIADDSAISTNPAPEASVEPAPEPELQTELLCTAADPQTTPSSFGPEIFMPTTGIRVCTEQEEQMYCGGCFCMIIRGVPNCFC